METQKTEKITIRNHEFSQELRQQGITNLDRCYQCYACSDCCPMAYAMDYYPNELIHMARMGLKEKVIQSKAIWVCVSCWTCATRCPNEIDIVRFMDVLRKESLNGGIKSPVNEIPQFHRVFMKEIQKRGRIDELRLLIRYKLKADGFFSLKRIPKDVMLGLKMFLKGKFKFCSQKMAGQKEVDKIFKKVLHEQ